MICIQFHKWNTFAALAMAATHFRVFDQCIKMVANGLFKDGTITVNRQDMECQTRLRSDGTFPPTMYMQNQGPL